MQDGNIEYKFISEFDKLEAAKEFEVRLIMKKSKI